MSVDEIRKMIVQALREVVPATATLEVNPSDSLAALGADSMDRADIVMDVLERMGLRVPLVETFGPNNIDELAARLHELSSTTAEPRG